jgi:hypothetical protein
MTATSDRTTPTVNNNVDYWVGVNILSTSTYQFNATFNQHGATSRLHFSMIIFDQVDVQTSGQYLLVY